MVEAIARRIAGPDTDADALEHARQIAEAQVDLDRVRAYRRRTLGDEQKLVAILEDRARRDSGARPVRATRFVETQSCDPKFRRGSNARHHKARMKFNVTWENVRVVQIESNGRLITCASSIIDIKRRVVAVLSGSPHFGETNPLRITLRGSPDGEGQEVFVIGNVMFDRYPVAEFERISPEARISLLVEAIS